ncbi:MAG: Nascent polypeptide-associated complex protein [Euryarchaeota archaeon]|nr:Nascent polypeptide-associated complex protein [Euryarchaeota archaeon]MDE1879903.1 Nascent polypeptide-associated complex protein [Euryarchaeota archaeon]MDE2045486.1 Nascent polypeptide-associated complex protein [Thermoplasmata archaeon]
MIPGGRMNERNMRLMMKRMGMTTETLDDVEEVVIRRAQEEVVIEGAEVTVVTVQGVKTFQIVGNVTTRAKGSAPAGGVSTGAAPASPPASAGPPEEDVELVMEQAQVDHGTAVKALKEAGGEPAEAILRLLSQRKV